MGQIEANRDDTGKIYLNHKESILIASAVGMALGVLHCVAILNNLFDGGAVLNAYSTIFSIEALFILMFYTILIMGLMPIARLFVRAYCVFSEGIAFGVSLISGYFIILYFVSVPDGYPAGELKSNLRNIAIIAGLISILLIIAAFYLSWRFKEGFNDKLYEGTIKQKVSRLIMLLAFVFSVVCAFYAALFIGLDRSLVLFQENIEKVVALISALFR